MSGQPQQIDNSKKNVSMIALEMKTEGPAEQMNLDKVIGLNY